MSMKVGGIWDTVPAWRSAHTSKKVRTSKGCTSLVPHLIGPPSHWSPISSVPHLIGPPSHWSPISLIPQLAHMHHSFHWSPISLVPRLIGLPSHWSPISLVPFSLVPQFISPPLPYLNSLVPLLIGPPFHQSTHFRPIPLVPHNPGYTVLIGPPSHSSPNLILVIQFSLVPHLIGPPV